MAAPPPWAETDAAAMKSLKIEAHVPKDTALLRGKSQMPWQPLSARAEAAANMQAVRPETAANIFEILI